MSQRVGQRRALAIDLLCAIALAALALALAAGIGVIGFFALIVVLAMVLWLAIEAGVRWIRRRGRRG